MQRLLLATLLLALGLSAPSAQLSLTGVGPADGGSAAGTNFRITDTSAFRITDTGASRIIAP